MSDALIVVVDLDGPVSQALRRIRGRGLEVLVLEHDQTPVLTASNVVVDLHRAPLCGSFGTELDAGEGKRWNVLFPRGTWHGRNLKPIGGSITLDDKMFEEMIANWSAAGKPKLPIRKTHLHLVKDDPDLQASFGDLEDFRVTTAGLEALTDWNDDGRALVKSRKFRSWSPEWQPSHEDRRTGEAKGWWLSGTALTNDPFFSSMPHLAAAEPLHPPAAKEQPMNEQQKQLRASLGLAETATDAEVLAAQTKRNEQISTLTAEVTKLKGDAPNADVITAAVAPLQAQVTTLQADLKKRDDALLERDVDALVVKAKMGDGKTGRAIPDLLVATAKDIAKTKGLKASQDFLEAIPLTVPTQAVGATGSTEPLTASAASEQLKAEAEKLQKDGNITPWLSAVARNPELARIAQEGK